MQTGREGGKGGSPATVPDRGLRTQGQGHARGRATGTWQTLCAGPCLLALGKCTSLQNGEKTILSESKTCSPETAARAHGGCRGFYVTSACPRNLSVSPRLLWVALFLGCATRSARAPRDLGDPSSSVSTGHVLVAKRGLQDPRPAPGPEPQGQGGPSRTRAGLGQSHPSASSQFSPRWMRNVPPGFWSRWGGLRTPARPTICPDSQPVCPGSPSSAHHLPACLALLLAPPGPSGGDGAEARARPHCLGPAPSGTPAGKGTVRAWPGHRQGQEGPPLSWGGRGKKPKEGGVSLVRHPCWRGLDSWPLPKPSLQTHLPPPWLAALWVPGGWSAPSPNMGPPGPEKRGVTSTQGPRAGW